MIRRARMAIETGRARAAYAADPAKSRGRRYAEPASPTRNAFRRDCDRIIHSSRVPPAGAQDASLRLSRGRSLPHPAHPYAGSRADRPLAGARARARRGPGRGAGAGARSRPSAVRPCRRARARRSARAASAASITTRRRCASSPSWSAAMPPSTASISPGRRWKAWSSTTARSPTAPAARSAATPSAACRRRSSPTRKSRTWSCGR